MRADWKCFAEVFHLPSWAHKSGICMKCTATTDTYKDVACKFPRLTHWQFIERQLDLKRPVSTIYSVPLFQTSNFKLDWLHVVDLGVTPDCLGNCFHFLLPRLGKNASEQLSHLLLLIKQYYIEHDIKDGINNLTAGMVRASPSVSPKLKVKGAEARSLVGFAKALCEKYCDESKALDCGVKWAVIYLNKCHDLGLHRDTFNASNFQRAAQSFLLQYKSLEEAMGTDKLLWVLKPKFHMLFELAQTGDCPAMNWNYRDEEAGGTLARMARSRGGLHNPWSVSSRCLQRFCWTTMCPSCEKKQSCKFCSSRAVVKDVVGKARCPKKYEKYS